MKPVIGRCHMIDEGPSEDDLARFDDTSARCDQCGAEMYDDAEMCPKCGAFQIRGPEGDTRNPFRKYRVLMVVVVALLLLSFLYWGMGFF